jgi:hypothetical protein
MEGACVETERLLDTAALRGTDARNLADSFTVTVVRLYMNL